MNANPEKGRLSTFGGLLVVAMRLRFRRVSRCPPARIDASHARREPATRSQSEAILTRPKLQQLSSCTQVEVVVMSTLWTKEEVANFCAISTRTVNRYMVDPSREFPAPESYIAGGPRWEPEKVIAWANGRNDRKEPPKRKKNK